MTRQEIQDKIDAAGPGSMVEIPAGKHILDAALHLKNGVTLQGVGTASLLMIDPAKDIEEAKDINFINNRCHGHRRHGLVTNYGNLVPEGLEVRDNTCHDNRWAGIYVQTNIAPDDVDQATDADFENFVIENNVCEHNACGHPSLKVGGDNSIAGGIVLNGPTKCG